MKSLIEGLPPDVARRIHPYWQENEAEYWAHREELLTQYRGQWVGFAPGRVIVAGTSPVEVLHRAQDPGEHPFVTCVGHEHEPSRMRRASFPYDTTYPGEPLSVMPVEIRRRVESRGQILQQLIPDTGADAGADPRYGGEKTGARGLPRCGRRRE